MVLLHVVLILCRRLSLACVFSTFLLLIPRMLDKTKTNKDSSMTSNDELLYYMLGQVRVNQERDWDLPQALCATDRCHLIIIIIMFSRRAMVTPDSH